MNIWKFLRAFALLYLSAPASWCLAQGVSNAVGGLTSSPTRASPASVFWNPATIGGYSGTQIESNLTLFGGWLIYDRQGTDPNTGQNFASSDLKVLAPNPFISASSNFGLERYRFGYATYFPGGALAHYPANGSQRYELIRGYIVPWNHQLTVAYCPDDHWIIGAGFISSIAFFKTEFDIDLAPVVSSMLNDSTVPRESPSLAARARVPSSVSPAFGGSLGILYRPSIPWAIGLSVVSPFTYTFHQNLNLEMPNIISALGAGPEGLGLESEIQSRADFKFETPAVVNFGLRYQPYGYWSGEYFGRYLFGSKTHFTSVKFRSSDLAVLERANVAGAKADDAFVLATTQTFSLFRRTQFGATTAYSSPGAKDRSISPSRVGFHTVMVGGFARYNFNSRFRLGLEYAHNFVVDRNVTTAANDSSGISVFEKPTGNGRYRASADRVGVHLGYEF